MPRPSRPCSMKRLRRTRSSRTSLSTSFALSSPAASFRVLGLKAWRTLKGPESPDGVADTLFGQGFPNPHKREVNTFSHVSNSSCSSVAHCLHPSCSRLLSPGTLGTSTLLELARNPEPQTLLRTIPPYFSSAPHAINGPATCVTRASTGWLHTAIQHSIICDAIIVI